MIKDAIDHAPRFIRAIRLRLLSNDLKPTSYTSVPITRLFSRWPSRIRPEAPQHTVRQWLVLQQNANPSTDYYVRPHLEETGLPIVYRSLDSDAPHADDMAPGTGVVVVRYLNRAWAKALHAHRPLLAGITYFMDDDLLGPMHWAGLPKPYIKKLDRYCRAHAADIHTLSSSYWMSTQALLNRYAHLDARLLPPRALADDMRYQRPFQTAGGPGVQIFYHGSSAHRDEHEWLAPIIAQVLHRCPQAHFEVIGDHDVNVRYRNLPRTRILHPMSWQNYLSHCRMLDGHIGLAPLLPSPFNAARAHVKVYDIARCGAVGLYTADAPYDQAVSHDHDGLLLPNQADAWVDAISELVNDRARLDTLRMNAGRFRPAAASSACG